MTNKEKARSLLNAARIFATGCGNPGLPEDCEECRKAYLDVCARLVRGEGEPVPDYEPAVAF